MKTISLIGWETFQHYKDRDPPWIKLYRDILTTESWVLGTDVSRLVQVASMLLAVRYRNRIPLNWPLLKKVASLDCTEKQFMEALTHLEASHFLTIEKNQEVTSESECLEHLASTPLATCTSETEEIREETEQRRSEQKPSLRSGSAQARKTRRCPPEFAITPELREWARAESPGVDVDRETASFKDHEFRTPHSDWPAAWRNWMRRAMDMRPPRPNGSGRESISDTISRLHREADEAGEPRL